MNDNINKNNPYSIEIHEADNRLIWFARRILADYMETIKNERRYSKFEVAKELFFKTAIPIVAIGYIGFKFFRNVVVGWKFFNVGDLVFIKHKESFGIIVSERIRIVRFTDESEPFAYLVFNQNTMKEEEIATKNLKRA